MAEARRRDGAIGASMAVYGRHHQEEAIPRLRHARRALIGRREETACRQAKVDPTDRGVYRAMQTAACRMIAKNMKLFYCR